MTKQKAYDKFGQWMVVLAPMNDPIVSCNRIRLAMIKESNPQFRLPKWDDVDRLEQRVGKESLLEMLFFSFTSPDTIKETLFHHTCKTT